MTTKQDFIIGLGSSIAAVPIIQPLMYFKNQRQLGVTFAQLINSNPFYWYRGTLGFTTSFGPKIALQTMTKWELNKHFNSLFSSVAAGIISAVVVSPSEIILINQQSHGKRYRQTVADIYKIGSFSIFVRGMLATMMREGISAGVIFEYVPEMKKRLIEMNYSSITASLIAGISGGIFATIITHPSDSFKTQVQKKFSHNPSLFKAHLILDSWKNGLTPRLAIVIVITTILPIAQELLNFKSNIHQK
jgi:hypothetical protein